MYLNEVKRLRHRERERERERETHIENRRKKVCG
jgi:hypothetical protein